MDCAHPHDISTIIDNNGVAIRAGHHCAQPLMDRLDLPSTARASVGVYTTRVEFDVLAESLEGPANFCLERDGANAGAN